MRFALVPAVALAMAFALADVVAGQNQVKFVASRTTAPASRTTAAARRTTASHRTAQRIDLDGSSTPERVPTPAEGPAGPDISFDPVATAEVGAGYVPSEMTSQIAPGAAFAVDMHNLYPNQAWPGVPPCCDPWVGYCHEPRPYGCWRGQGYYTHYDTHNCDKCGGPGEWINYHPGFSEVDRPACFGGGCGAGGCGHGATCRHTSYQPGVKAGCAGCEGNSSDTGPALEGAPAGTNEPQAPRNDLPKKPAGPTARRPVSRPST